MSLLQPSDFTGIYNVAYNEFTEVELQQYIDKFEPIYLIELLGASMYDDFVADLDTAPNITTSSVPTSPKFTKIFNSFYEDEGSCIVRSEGFKEMLKGLIYFDYVRDQGFVINITGATKNKFSNSEIARTVETRAIENWNRSMHTWNVIRWYICDNPLAYDYDNYNGVEGKLITWL